MTNFTPDSFNELDLRRALSGHAAAVRPQPDTARLESGLQRADRLQTVRMAALGTVAVLTLTFGVANLNGVGESSSVDTFDQPELDAPIPDPTLPVTGDADAELQTVDTTTTTEAPVETPAQPDHLAPPTTSAAIPATVTTAAPSTTAAPTTTGAPATTAAPTTTSAPTTTIAAPTTTTTTASVSLTATARYGSCELDPPYDVYSGQATPGATVTITSPHSDPVQTTAGSDAHWEITVFFPAAPLNESFTVSFNDGTDTRTVSFVRTG